MTMPKQAKNLSVKQIAKLSGVSAGTVDRVIHNRGNVSPEKKTAIEKVLNEIGYEPNLQKASIGMKRSIVVVAVLPEAEKGYWRQIKQGIMRTQYELSLVSLKVRYLHYNQFNLFSCREVYAKALGIKCDAMIIGPTFTDETIQMAAELEIKGIPYVYVDANIERTNPLSFFGPDAISMGAIQARLLTEVVEKGKSIVMMHAKRVGDSPASNILLHRNGFSKYLKDNSLNVPVIDCTYDVTNQAENESTFDNLFSTNPNIGGIAVFNSRAYLVASYLKNHNIQNIKLIGYGLIEENIKKLKEGYISFLLSERPEEQGKHALRAILEYLFYGKQPRQINNNPVDILIRENINFYIDGLQ